MKFLFGRNGFTLAEIAIVVAIIAILGGALLFALNPIEALRQARDQRRFSEIGKLNVLLSQYRYSSIRDKSLGSTETVYISIPDSSPTCANLSLSPLSGGWEYHCVSSSTLYSVDGGGWLPVDFTALSHVDISVLFTDPVNSTSSLYYSYVTDGDFYELNAWTESEQFGAGGSKDKVSSDGGDDDERYESGTDLFLFP